MKIHSLKQTALVPLLAAVILLVFMTGIAAAAAAGGAKDEKKLDISMTMINNDAKLPQGEKVVTEQLTKTFDVKKDKIQSLKAKNLQFGEIAAVLALADTMEGGLTDANLNRVVSLRQGRTGWSQIASNLNLDLSDVADKVASLEDDTHKEIKSAAVESAAGAGAGGGEGEMPRESDEPETSGGGAGGGSSSDRESGSKY
jgi:hypothetical protein